MKVVAVRLVEQVRLVERLDVGVDGLVRGLCARRRQDVSNALHRQLVADVVTEEGGDLLEQRGIGHLAVSPSSLPV